jgi:CheY-like chemotaxis protein
VDDNFTNRRVLEGMLRLWGMHAEAVESGPAALPALREAQSGGRAFHLILLDGQMPDMDGFALAEIIHKDESLAGIKLMMLTSAGRAGDGARCREAGISAYLTKPISQKELLEGVCALLQRTPEKRAEVLVTRHTLREQRNRRRVLVAEDNLVNQTLALRVLEKHGYEVTIAGDGQAAVHELQKGSFDVVLMDVEMPVMDGLEATAAIREREKADGSHTPIIAMTAHSLKGDAERFIAGGMDAYVSKPIRTNELFATIEMVLAKSDGNGAVNQSEMQKNLTP